MKKSADKKPMPFEERREVLEAIARDEDAYPRDRIAAVRALEEMAKVESPEDELDRILTK